MMYKFKKYVHNELIIGFEKKSLIIFYFDSWLFKNNWILLSFDFFLENKFDTTYLLK